MKLSNKQLKQIISEEIEKAMAENDMNEAPKVGDIYVNLDDPTNTQKEIIIKKNKGSLYTSFQFKGNGYADSFGFVMNQIARMKLDRFRRNFGEKNMVIDPETGVSKVEPIYTLGNRGQNVNESVTKEEIVWLMEQCGDMPQPAGDVGGCGGDDIMTITGMPDHEIEMARKQLRKTADYAGKLQGMMDGMPEDNLPAWVQAKITSSSDAIGKVYHYLEEYLTGAQMDKGMADGEETMISGEITSVNEAEVSIDKNLSTNHEQRRVDALMDKIMAGLITITPEQVDQIEKVLAPEEDPWLTKEPQKYPSRSSHKI